ncbi:MAG: GDSL-type esterase/lipase family protein [Ilumatobacteraceae bacterium]
MITRRNVLLGGLAAMLGACSTRGDVGDPVVNVARPGSRTSIDDGGVLDQPNPEPAKVPESVVMVGDSISALSEPALDLVLGAMGFQTVTINAEPSRRIEVGRRNPTNGLDVVTFVAGASPPDMWVIALGTNDAGLYATDEEYQGLIDGILAAIGNDVPLVWVNAYRNDHLDGCRQFNELLEETLDERGNATIADWYQLCVDNSSAILTGDGVHPNNDGILVFADTVRAAIATQLA